MFACLAYLGCFGGACFNVYWLQANTFLVAFLVMVATWNLWGSARGTQGSFRDASRALLGCMWAPFRLPGEAAGLHFSDLLGHVCFWF